MFLFSFLRGRIKDLGKFLVAIFSIFFLSPLFSPSLAMLNVDLLRGISRVRKLFD